MNTLTKLNKNIKIMKTSLLKDIIKRKNQRKYRYNHNLRDENGRFRPPYEPVRDGKGRFAKIYNFDYLRKDGTMTFNRNVIVEAENSFRVTGIDINKEEYRTFLKDRIVGGIKKVKMNG